MAAEPVSRMSAALADKGGSADKYQTIVWVSTATARRA